MFKLYILMVISIPITGFTHNQLLSDLWFNTLHECQMKMYKEIEFAHNLFNKENKRMGNKTNPTPFRIKFINIECVEQK